MRKTDTAKYCGFLVACVAFASLVGVAQGGSMGNGAAQRARAAAAAAPQDSASRDAAIAKRCQAQAGLMNTQMCKDAKARHPEAFDAKPKSAPSH